MKTNPEIRAKKAAFAINQVKMIKHFFMYNFNTKKDELVNLLRENECPYPTVVAALLVRRNFIKKKAGLYAFTTDKPIYYKCILNDLNNAVKASCEASRNQYNKTAKVIKTITYFTVINGSKINVALFNGQDFVILNPLLLCAKSNTPIESNDNDIYNVRCASDLFLLFSKQTLKNQMVKECLREDTISN